MKHHNGKERRSVIVQFSLWFLAACALVALTAYSFAKIDVSETESLRNSYSDVQSVQDRSATYTDDMDKLESTCKAIQSQYNALQANAKEWKADVGPNLENAQREFSDASVKFNKGINQSLTHTDSLLFVVADEYNSTLTKILDLTSSAYNEINSLNRKLAEQNIELRDKKEEVNRLESKVEKLETKIENL